VGGDGLASGHSFQQESWSLQRQNKTSSLAMYDFCISPIYAAVLLAGGLHGYAAKGSVESLGACPLSELFCPFSVLFSADRSRRAALGPHIAQSGPQC
jgi:hypothetical protein